MSDADSMGNVRPVISSCLGIGLAVILLAVALPQSLGAQANLENPQAGSFQSGIGLVSGWVCNASRIDIEFDDSVTVQAAHGTSRGDTISVCGDADNGFGLLVNWSLLGDGVHTVRALADGVEVGKAAFTVTTLGTEFLRGASANCRVFDFPRPGTDAILQWQESHQNFVIAEVQSGDSRSTAINRSSATLCAEEDNVNIPLYGSVKSFTIAAMHPTYAIGTDSCAPSFSNCSGPSGPTYSFSPGVFKLLDDGETVVEAVRETSWWRPHGMQVSVNGNTPAMDIHYVRVSRKIADANEWPQFFVLYMDGSLRLIPHPPAGASSVCFGSSVIIGPAVPDTRPIAEIESARYVSASKTIEVVYQNGGSAILTLQEVNRTRARVEVAVSYPTDTHPFATFRSMFVTEGNADVDHVRWADTVGDLHDDPIMTFPGGEGGEWLFHRTTHSQHNTSAPDVMLKVE